MNRNLAIALIVVAVLLLMTAENWLKLGRDTFVVLSAGAVVAAITMAGLACRLASVRKDQSRSGERGRNLLRSR